MTRRVDNSRKARIEVIAGSSGSGKTSWLKQRVKNEKRLIIWDPKAEYDARDKCVTVYSQRDLLQIIKNHNDMNLRVSFQPNIVNQSMFDWWSKMVLAWGECYAIAEETADVTTPSKAPDGWGQLIRKGRGLGIGLGGVTQRPAESDKTIIGNATLIHCGRLSRQADRVYMAKEMNTTPDVLMMDDLEFIDYDPRKPKEHKKGKVSFKSSAKTTRKAR